MKSTMALIQGNMYVEIKITPAFGIMVICLSIRVFVHPSGFPSDVYIFVNLCVKDLEIPLQSGNMVLSVFVKYGGVCRNP